MSPSGRHRYSASRFNSAVTSLLAASFLAAKAALPDDRVTVQPEGTSSPVIVVGDVDEFNNRRIVIRLESGQPVRSFPAESVLQVETTYLPAQTRGLAAFRTGDYAVAENEFISAANDEPRHWVRQEILSWLVRCAMRRNDRLAAGKYFIRMVQADPETRYWEVVPLIWSAENVGQELRTEAQSWLAASLEGVKLLGAGMLLLDPQFTGAAQDALERLSRSTDPWVQSLARAQEWRMRLLEGSISENELAGWRQRTGRMPAAIRGGPMYLVGRATTQQGDLLQAAADWLWLPLVYDSDEPLSARACFEAAEALADLGRIEEAVPLYDEVMQRYGWSPFAADARRRLTELAQEGASDAAS